MRRVVSVLGALALLAGLLAVIGVPAFANHRPGHDSGGGGGNLPAGCAQSGGGQVTCITEETFTEEETLELDQRTEFRKSTAVAPCTVGRSDRVGTQEGIETDEVLITTFGVFEVTFKKTTTTVFQGNPQAGNIVGTPTMETEETGRTPLREFEEEEVVDTTFEATGRCQNVPGPQNPRAVG